MKIKQYVFDWVDKMSGEKQHAVKYGKYGEDWKKDFENHPDLCDLKSCKINEIEIKKGMEFVSDEIKGWVLIVDNCISHDIEEKHFVNPQAWLRDIEINGTGDCLWHADKEHLEKILDWYGYELKEVA